MIEFNRLDIQKKAVFKLKHILFTPVNNPIQIIVKQLPCGHKRRFFFWYHASKFRAGF